MTSEEDFARALRASAALAPEPPTETFALAAERRGRGRVVRRRAAGASALALVAAAACALTLLPDPPAARPAPAAVPFTQQSMSDILRSLLPTGGTVTDKPFYQVGSRTPTMAMVGYDDGTGPVEVTVVVDRLATPLSDAASALQCPDPLAEPTATCRTATRPDGSRLVTTVTAPRWDGDDRSWAVTYTAPDGRMVRAGEVADGSVDRPAREQPAVTEAQLLDLATSDAWRPAFAELPASTVPPAAPAAGPAVLAALRAALPAGATLDAGPGTQDTPGRAHGAVTFGGRTSQLVVSVEHGWQRGFPTDPATRFHDMAYDETYSQNPDGTRFFVREFKASIAADQGSAWLASALLPDGTVVTVKLWTYGPGYRFATGPGALDQEQLVALATAPSWMHA